MLAPDLWGLVVVGLAFGAAWAVVRLLFRGSPGRVAMEACFVAYVVALLYVTVFAYWHPGHDQLTFTWRTINLVPLLTIIELARPEHITQAVRQLGGNIVMFIPLGILLPALGERYRSFGPLAFAAFSASVSVELLQLVLRLIGVMSRSVDVDDVILNTAGAIVGWALWRWMHGVLRLTERSGVPTTEGP